MCATCAILARRMPRFQPGISGNPKGRTPGSGAPLAYLRELAGKDGRLYLDRLHQFAMGTDRRYAMEALKLLLPYVAGKPADVQVQVNLDALREMSDDDLAAAVRVAEALTGG